MSEWWSCLDKAESLLQQEDIHALLPHRGDMSFLSRALIVDEGGIGEVCVQENAFWVPGHFPVPVEQKGPFEIGPIFPGVLMVESSAQLGILCWRYLVGIEKTASKTMLFKQIDRASFKKEARPGDRVLIRTHIDKYSTRLMRCTFEGIVLGGDTGEASPCFECTIAGMSV